MLKGRGGERQATLTPQDSPEVLWGGGGGRWAGECLSMEADPLAAQQLSFWGPAQALGLLQEKS